MRVLITDVTEMSAGNYCVAGWCADEERMVRPLPNGANWTAGLLQAHAVEPGVAIRVHPTGALPNGIFPHRTEDTIVARDTIQRINAAPAGWFGANAPPTAPTLDDAFQGQLAHNSVWDGCRQGVHVPVMTNCRSLWAVRLHRERLTFVEDFSKLKAILDDGFARYKLSISSRRLKELWRGAGLDGIEGHLPTDGSIHVRVGLAREFSGQPGKCFAMINGVYW